jgi:hypothetical protein
VAARVLGARLDVVALVAGRGDEEHLAVPGDHVRLRLGLEAAAPRDVDHPRAGPRGVGVGADRVADAPVAPAVEHPQRQQGDVPGDAGDPDAVSARRGEDAADVRAVPVGVRGRRVAVPEVEAVDVVDEAVAVVVAPVAGRLAGVRPQIGAQVRGGRAPRRRRRPRRAPGARRS